MTKMTIGACAFLEAEGLYHAVTRELSWGAPGICISGVANGSCEPEQHGACWLNRLGADVRVAHAGSRSGCLWLGHQANRRSGVIL